MGMRVLPPGMIGVLLAAMLASAMASLSAYNHIITGIFAKDLYQGYLRRDASDRHMLKASRITSLGVGLVMIGIALLFAQGASGIFTLLFILESMFLIPLGLPLLYGFLIKARSCCSSQRVSLPSLSTRSSGNSQRRSIRRRNWERWAFRGGANWHSWAR